MPQTLMIKKIDGKPGQVYYPIEIKDVRKPAPGPGEVLVRIQAAALNHRDFFIRQHLYPQISFESPALCDGSGTVVELGPQCSPAAASLLDKLVILVPIRGWASDPDGPEDEAEYTLIGSAKRSPHGTAQDYIVVHESEVVLCPGHLSPIEGAALPLCGLTAWRALVTKSRNAKPGRNILVTGIGGGVALLLLQLAVAMGVNVFVTSGSDAKIGKAVDLLGAKGGVNYKAENWEKRLQKMLPPERPFLDAVIDGAGGDIMMRVLRLLKSGGVVTSYGMTLGPKMDWPMPAVMRQIDLVGSTTGSKAEFQAMLSFVAQHKIRPVVSRVVQGLDNLQAIEDMFQEMHRGAQFGKLVIYINSKPQMQESHI